MWLQLRICEAMSFLCSAKMVSIQSKRESHCSVYLQHGDESSPAKGSWGNRSTDVRDWNWQSKPYFSHPHGSLKRLSSFCWQRSWTRPLQGDCYGLAELAQATRHKSSCRLPLSLNVWVCVCVCAHKCLQQESKYHTGMIHSGSGSEANKRARLEQSSFTSLEMSQHHICGTVTTKKNMSVSRNAAKTYLLR